MGASIIIIIPTIENDLPKKNGANFKAIANIPNKIPKEIPDAILNVLIIEFLIPLILPVENILAT